MSYVESVPIIEHFLLYDRIYAFQKVKSLWRCLYFHEHEIYYSIFWNVNVAYFPMWLWISRNLF